MNRCVVIAVTLAASFFGWGCGLSMREKQMEQFIRAHVDKMAPMAKASALAQWQAANSGAAEDYAAAADWELRIRQVYSDGEAYEWLKEQKASGAVKGGELSRQLERLYYGYLKNQIDADLLERTVALSTSIQEDFNTFRGRIDGEAVTANAIREILKTEVDSGRRAKAWEASKQVGAAVANDLIQLVKLRNEAARKVGFENFHTLSLTAGEQDVGELDGIFQELEERTREPFAQLKGELDAALAQRYGITAGEMEAWHYHDPFFQEAPQIYEVDLDGFYQGADVRELAERFFAGIDLPVEAILASSDLYEREGKLPHAFCTDIDREGDVRILCNLKNNEQWMGTLLHELGHAVYDRYHDTEVPYLLREPAHIFTTEGIAMFFGRLSHNPAWMEAMLGLSGGDRERIAQVSGKFARLKQLIFVRWAMVMYEFEKRLYADPDQDLNGLWWELVARYQMIDKPVGRDEPDWAAKIHFSIAPCYYHNYVLGELFASQLHHYIVREELQSAGGAAVNYVEQRQVGAFLRRAVFADGAVYHWNEMIARATGEGLSPRYFVMEFVE